MGFKCQKCNHLVMDSASYLTISQLITTQKDFVEELKAIRKEKAKQYKSNPTSKIVDELTSIDIKLDKEQAVLNAYHQCQNLL